ncbi:MAG: rhamnulokinase family protein [Trueperaceae bacterium]
MSGRGDYLAVDMGASGVRLIHGAFDGARFALTELDRFENGPVRVLGDLHWDVLGLWRQLRQGLARFGRDGGEPPAGVGVDTWGVDFALLDERGSLLGTPFHYRDRRTQGMPELLARRISSERMYACTGIQVMQINTMYQLLAMAEANDPRLSDAARLLMMPDLFAYWLSGVQAGEYTIASTSQMLDATRREWATGLLAEIGLPESILPPLVIPGSVLGNLHPDLADAIPGFEETQVIAVGGHDTASAVAAIPELDESSAFISSGTWSLVGVEVGEPVLDQRARELNFTNEGGVGGTIRLLKNVAGLWLLQESRRRWRREGLEVGWQEILARAEAAPAFRSIIDPDAPEFLSPDDMVAAIAGHCRRIRQPEPDGVGPVVRCCLESLALRYRWVLDALEELTGRNVETIRIVGGGSRNDLLNQLTADACGRPVVAGPVEATALGNLMVQAIATGRLAGVEAGRQAVADSVHLRRFEPTPHAGTRDAWQEAYDRFRAVVTR